MKQTVKLLSVSLTMLLTNGWTSLFWCETPDVTPPVVDNTRYYTNLDSSKQCVKNYFLMKEYAEKLNEANGVCK